MVFGSLTASQQKELVDAGLPANLKESEYFAFKNNPVNFIIDNPQYVGAFDKLSEAQQASVVEDASFFSSRQE